MYFILILTTGLIVGFAAGYLVKKKTVSVKIVEKEIFSKEHSFSTDLLDSYTGKIDSGNIPKNSKIIKKTLHDHGIEVTMGDVNIGSTVTQYLLRPADGVQFSQIAARINELSLALASHPIRIAKTFSNKSIIGVEIPNKITAIVSLREILDSQEFRKSKSNLTLALGRDVAGQVIIADLKETPHILIAGATGSGKSVCIHAMILALLYQNTSKDLRLILDDAKRVEDRHYYGIPHLLCPVIYNVNETVSALRWAVAESKHRLLIFKEFHQSDIESYNQNPLIEKLLHIVIFIDEFSDMMAQAGNEVEAAVVRLAQVGQKTGIHLVMATSRPSTDVMTGIIKANIPGRIGFATASQIDSRTIIDASGAEKLLSRGDMLFHSNELSGFKRIQGSLVTDNEIKKITDFLKNETPPNTSDQLIDLSSKDGSCLEDDFYEDAKKVVLNAGLASAQLLQRRLRIGYARANNLLDLLEEKHIIGPEDGPKPRKVLIKAELKEADAKKKK